MGTEKTVFEALSDQVWNRAGTHADDGEQGQQGWGERKYVKDSHVVASRHDPAD